jgi:hypothetical protein
MRTQRRYVVALLALTTACATTPAVLPGMDRPEVVAFALYGSFVIVEEAAATIAENPATPPAVSAALIAADEAAVPYVRQLRPLAEQVEGLRAAVVSGQASVDELLAAVAELQRLLDQVAPLIRRFNDLVTEAR